MPHYVLAIDLPNDPKLIAEYEDYHTKVWPEIISSIHACGILRMEIFRFSNRMAMLIDTTDDFTFERKAEMDAANPAVQKWYALMTPYQAAIPGARPGERWVEMKKIFDTTT